MRRGLLLVAALVAGTFLAHFFMADAGYALVHFRGIAIETSVLGLALFALLAYIAVRLIVRALSSVSDLGRVAGRYQKNQSRKKLTRGLIEVAEGNFSRGERLLAESAHSSDTPVLNYLSAARAAQSQGATERRDNWLMMAYESDEDSSRAVLLTQAQLQAADADYERALATLRKLEEQSPGHPQGLALLAEIYQHLGDWENLRELLPQLRKRKAVSPEQLERLTQLAWARLLEHDGTRGDVVSLQRKWQALPRKLKADPELFRDYVVALNRTGDAALAEQAMRKSLKSSWDPQLVDLYGRLENLDANMMLGHVKGWLKHRPEDPAALLAAGRLALLAKDYETAGQYLDTAIKVDPSPAAYQVYGALLTEKGDNADAAIAFRKGLALATGRIETTLPTVSNTTAPDNNPASPEEKKKPDTA